MARTRVVSRTIPVTYYTVDYVDVNTRDFGTSEFCYPDNHISKKRTIEAVFETCYPSRKVLRTIANKREDALYEMDELEYWMRATYVPEGR